MHLQVDPYNIALGVLVIIAIVSALIMIKGK